VLHPAETASHLSTNGECLAIMFVPAAYMITVIGTFNLVLGCTNGCYKFGKIHISGKFSIISRVVIEDLCKLGKEYINSLTCKFYTLILKLLTYYTLFFL